MTQSEAQLQRGQSILKGVRRQIIHHLPTERTCFQKNTGHKTVITAAKNAMEKHNEN